MIKKPGILRYKEVQLLGQEYEESDHSVALNEYILKVQRDIDYEDMMRQFREWGNGVCNHSYYTINKRYCENCWQALQEEK